MAATSNKQRKLLYIILVNCCIVVGMLYLFEGFLWLTDPQRRLPFNGMRKEAGQAANGWDGYVRYTWGHRVVNNRFGFREADFAVPKPKGVYRIMVLGDSLTWGQGLAIEERYTNLLEASLSKAMPHRKIEVLNFGLQGYPTVQERDVLKKYEAAVQPDLIIVGFCYNDPKPKFESYSVQWDQFNRRNFTFFYFLGKLDGIGLKRTGKKIKDAVYHIAGMRGAFPPWEEVMEESYRQNSIEWRNFEEALRDIKSISDRRRLPAPIFAVLNEGVYTDRPTDYNNPDVELKRRLRWYHQAEVAAARIGFKTINFEKEISRELNHEILAVNIVDRHPSASLNRIYAKSLAELVVKQMKSQP